MPINKILDKIERNQSGVKYGVDIWNIYDFLYITSNVSKRQYHYNITLSKRYNGRRSLNLPTRGLFALMPAPYLNVHLSNKVTFIIYIRHFMFPTFIL